MTDKIHLNDGSIHFVGKPMEKMASPTERLKFLNSQLEAQLTKTQKAAKFLAMKLDAIAKARLAFAQHIPEAEDPPSALDTFIAVIDEALTAMGFPPE